MKGTILKSRAFSPLAAVIMLLALVALPAAAQKRDKVLNITVAIATGESLEGQQVNVKQTDYGVAYPAVTLDAQGKATLKAYAGNHNITVERSGYTTATESFNIADTDTEKDVTLTLTEKTRTPFALTAKLNVDAFTGKNGVAMTWNTEQPAFYDDFESYDAFAISFGNWTGIDGDHLQAAPLTGDYPNRGVMQYAQIINPLTVDPMWWYSYPVLRPYEGKQYVGFVRTSSGDANNDWLISPEITIGTDNILCFYAKAADKYTEKFIVYVTTKTDAPEQSDFTPLTTGNYDGVDYKQWHEMKYDLAAYAGQKVKLAIRYIGDANDGGAFMLMVDDFYVGPQEYAANEDSSASAKTARLSAASRPSAQRMPLHSPANPNEEFDIYEDGEVVGTTSGYTFTVDNVTEGAHTFGVKAKYISAESELVTTSVNVSHDDYAKVGFTVAADSKLTVDGQKISILSTENAQTYELTVKDGAASLAALPKGEYMLNIEKAAFKQYSNTVQITADTTFNLLLEDDVLQPYNITADLTTATDGTTTAALRWNQNLGFSDSFEQYDDFSTGSFGEWKTVDNDQMPVYPISLGGSIITFPGSGSQSNPTAIAPMVFNPWNTQPAMLPTDSAMQAPDGDKYIIFFSPQGAKADKWLISPEISVYDDYELKVTAKSYTDQYPESIEFAVAEGSDNPSDFTTISSAYNMPSDEWFELTTSLSDYAGKKVRLGVHYVSYDTFFAQLDDFHVGPAEGKSQSMDYGNVVKYCIYLDGTLVGETETAQFTLTGLSGGDHVIGIEAVYKNQTSERSLYNITVSAIGRISIDAVPTTADVYTLSGQKVESPLSSMPKGIYVVKNGTSVIKVRK